MKKEEQAQLEITEDPLDNDPFRMKHKLTASGIGFAGRKGKGYTDEDLIRQLKLDRLLLTKKQIEKHLSLRKESPKKMGILERIRDFLGKH